MLVRLDLPISTKAFGYTAKISTRTSVEISCAGTHILKCFNLYVGALVWPNLIPL